MRLHINSPFLFSITEVLPGDIVFLTSDGISDNFDPVVTQLDLSFQPAILLLAHLNPYVQVGKFCVPKKPDRQGSTGSRGARTPGREPPRCSKQKSNMDYLVFVPYAFLSKERSFDHNTLLQTGSGAGFLADR